MLNACGTRGGVENGRNVEPRLPHALLQSAFALLSNLDSLSNRRVGSFLKKPSAGPLTTSSSVRASSQDDGRHRPKD